MGTVHVWWRNDHAVCGATDPGHDCYLRDLYALAGKPGGSSYWRWPSRVAPCCNRPMCRACWRLVRGIRLVVSV